MSHIDNPELHSLHFCSEIYLKAREHADARHSGHIRVGDVLKALEEIKIPSGALGDRHVKGFIESARSGNTTATIEALSRLYTSLERIPKKEIGQEQPLARLGKVLLDLTKVSEFQHTSLRSDLLFKQAYFGSGKDAPFSEEIGVFKNNLLQHIRQRFSRGHKLSKKEKASLNDKIARFEIDLQKVIFSLSEGKTVADCSNEIQQKLTAFLLEVGSVPQPLKKEIEDEVKGFTAELENVLRVKEKKGRRVQATKVLAPDTAAQPNEASGTLKIGDLLRSVNWMSPEYQKKKVGREIELRHLMHISKMLHASPPPVKASIAQTIKDWSHFDALPFQIRAAVRCSLQQNESSPVSYRRAVVEEFFGSLKRLITLQRVAGGTVKRELEKSVGDSLSALKGNVIWEELRELAAAKKDQYANVLEKMDRLLQIADTLPGWQNLLDADEKKALEFEYQKVVAKKRPGAERALREKLYKEEVGRQFKAASSPEEFGSKTQGSNPELFRTQAKDEVTKQINDPSSDFGKECMEVAEKKVLFEVRWRLEAMQKELFDDMSVVANHVLEQHAEKSGATIEELQKSIDKDPVWKHSLDKLNDLFLLVNDKERMGTATIEGVSGRQQLTSEEKVFLRGVVEIETKEQARREKLKARAIKVATIVAAVGALTLLTTTGLGYLPTIAGIGCGLLAILLLLGLVGGGVRF